VRQLETSNSQDKRQSLHLNLWHTKDPPLLNQSGPRVVRWLEWGVRERQMSTREIEKLNDCYQQPEYWLDWSNKEIFARLFWWLEVLQLATAIIILSLMHSQLNASRRTFFNLVAFSSNTWFWSWKNVCKRAAPTVYSRREIDPSTLDLRPDGLEPEIANHKPKSRSYTTRLWSITDSLSEIAQIRVRDAFFEASQESKESPEQSLYPIGNRIAVPTT